MTYDELIARRDAPFICPCCDKPADKIDVSVYRIHIQCERDWAVVGMADRMKNMRQEMIERLLRGDPDPPEPPPVKRSYAKSTTVVIDGPKVDKSVWRDGPLPLLLIVGTSKWLTVATCPRDMVFDDKVIVLTLCSYSAFGVLSSIAHEAWARFAGLNSTMQETARYTSSSIFETFAFPRPVDATRLGEMASRAEEYRNAFLQTQRLAKLGTTKLQNRLADPEEGCPWILDVRRARYELDLAVLRAYNWDDLLPPCRTDMPPCREAGPAPPVVDEIVSRLRALNSKRAAEDIVVPAQGSLFG